MRKFAKIFLISLVSLLGILMIAICIFLWVAFTPDRLTPIVRQQAGKYLTCKSEIGEVELTLFSTFPNFGLKVRNFTLINPVEGAKCDTLVNVEELIGVINATAWLRKKELIITGIELTNGTINIFSDSQGNTNYDIAGADTTAVVADESETVLPDIDISNIALNNVDLNYNDLSLKINTVIHNLTAEISGIVRPDSISGNLKASWYWTSLEYGGEKYIQQARILLNAPVDVIPSKLFIRLKNATASVNGLEVLLNGTVENDTLDKIIITNLRYRFEAWPVNKLMALVPSSFNSYFEGIEAEGFLTSQGDVKGIMNDSVMPMMDINLVLYNGTLKYAGFPIPLHDVRGDITLRSDLSTDSVSFVRINRFEAKTPESFFKTEGLITHLFSDIYCDLTTDAGLILTEFNPVIPDSMKMTVKGVMTGKVKSAFSMSQVEKMQIEKMKLSGSVTLTGFDFTYDSIFLKTDISKIDFALPNPNKAAGSAGFANAKILSGNMVAGKLASYNTSLQNSSLNLEMSDVRDTTRIPDLICSFKMDYLEAGMDTMSIAVARPNGNLSVSPRRDKPDQPKIRLSYNSDQLKAAMGPDKIEINKINLETDILNDNSQKDIFLQWLVKGFVDMDKGIINMSGLSYPIEIPSVKMNFEPETFNIKESNIKIDKSDFQLSGNLKNVLSYFRGDSILRGDFNFVSNNTDVLQLMSLTNGLGSSDSTAVTQPEESEVDSTYTGPYMVPKGIDVSLNANIKMATMGIDTATDILGDVKVHDGLLVLDGLTFTTPAARMQLTAMYRTPRKNHLFVGIDYHMMDVEIGELLTMIPDIDSLMPMLRSFGGRGEFHIAVEAYLDSLYNIKKSTLRGAASIRGNDLVLMDGETFSEIAKKLNFNKKTENRVDSLSAEFTIFRNEIDVYPFLIVLDKYKAVIAGRHNFDLSFDYHISIVDCPLPIKLGLDIKGTPDDMSFSLAPCRYAEFYRPASRHAVENKQLELRKMIRDALTQKVKE
jgi:hypothetical protein